MKSIVWDFYSRPLPSERATVECPKCQNKISYNGSTTVMLRHLQKTHNKVYQELCSKKEIEETAAYNRNSSEETRSEILLARSFCSGLIPFRFAANKEFLQFIKSINSTFKVPSPTTICRLIEKENVRYVDILRKEFDGIKSFVLITDGYSELRREFNFYSVHVSYIDSQFRKKLRFIGIKQLEKRGTADEISQATIGILRNVGLSLVNCSATITDGASALRAFSSNHLIPNVHCACHVLNLVFEEFGRIKEVEKIWKKSQAIAAILSRNKSVRKELQSLIQTRQERVPLPRPMSTTRWSSLYLQLRSLKSNMSVIYSVDETRPYKLQKQQISLLTSLVEVLEPVHQRLLHLESDNRFVSDILPSLVSLGDEISANTDKYSQRLAEMLTERISEYVGNNFVIACSVADPRFAFTPDLLSPRTWDEAVKLFTDFKENEYVQAASASSSLAKKPEEKGIGAFMMKKLAQYQTSDNTIETEILQYQAILNTSRPAYDSNPLYFWTSHSASFPIMSRISKNLLSGLSSSAVSERFFSKCSDVARQAKRTGIKTETLNSILMTVALSKKEYETKEDSSFSDEDDTWDSDETNPNTTNSDINMDELENLERDQEDIEPKSADVFKNDDEDSDM